MPVGAHRALSVAVECQLTALAWRSRGWRPWAGASAQCPEWAFPQKGRDEVGVFRWRTDKIVKIKYRKVQFSLWKCLVFVRKCCIYVGIFLRVELRHKKYVKPPHRSPSPSISRSRQLQSAIGRVRFDFGESEAVGCVQLALSFCTDRWCFPTVKPNGRYEGRKAFVWRLLQRQSAGGEKAAVTSS